MYKILVTGGAGFLGSVLVPMLLDQGHEITVIDNFMYKQTSLMAHCHNPKLTIINKDVRDCSHPIFDADAVIPLAALVGAPICAKDSTTATEINFKAIKYLCGILRPDQTILLPMTNSGYGTGGETECTEESTLCPVSLYGQSKVWAEEAVLNHPRGISFRFATLFGCSPRMRLDLLVNTLVHKAVTDRAIVLFEEHFRRNYLHVRDAAKIFLFAIKHAEKKQMFGQAFNAGDSRSNLTKLELANKIKTHLPETEVFKGFTGKDPDKRDYLVSNTKLESLGWSPQHTLDDGILELIKGFAMPFTTNFTNT